RYAGWVTNDADDAKVSRASVYAALAAFGQCDADHGYDGALVSGALCVDVHPDLNESECLAHMKASRGFGIATVARTLATKSARAAHQSDPPRMAAFLGHGKVACGGTDRWKLEAPTDFVDRYVSVYNAYHALSVNPPSCSKRIIATVALYSGMGDPGVDGVT